MAIIGFPDGEFRKILSSFFALKESEFSDFHNALRSIGTNLNFLEAANSIKGALKSNSLKDKVEIYLSVLLSLEKTRLENQIQLDTAAKDVASTLITFEEKNKRVLPKDDLEKRIKEILSVSELERWIKADTLLRDNEHNFKSSKILTDIRSVFDTSDDKPFSNAATIIHNLKITYEDTDGVSREFFVALDEDDIQQLQQTLEKATKKTSHIIGKLNKEKTTYYFVGKSKQN